MTADDRAPDESRAEDPGTELRTQIEAARAQLAATAEALAARTARAPAANPAGPPPATLPGAASHSTRHRPADGRAVGALIGVGALALARLLRRRRLHRPHR